MFKCILLILFSWGKDCIRGLFWFIVLVGVVDFRLKLRFGVIIVGVFFIIVLFELIVLKEKVGMFFIVLVVDLFEKLNVNLGCLFIVVGEVFVFGVVVGVVLRLNEKFKGWMLVVVVFVGWVGVFFKESELKLSGLSFLVGLVGFVVGVFKLEILKFKFWILMFGLGWVVVVVVNVEVLKLSGLMFWIGLIIEVCIGVGVGLFDDIRVLKFVVLVVFIGFGVDGVILVGLNLIVLWLFWCNWL